MICLKGKSRGRRKSNWAPTASLKKNRGYAYENMIEPILVEDRKSLSRMNQKLGIKLFLPVDVLEKIEEQIQGTSFRSVADFIEALVLQKFPSTQEYSEEEKKIIQERLRYLGYIE